MYVKAIVWCMGISDGVRNEEETHGNDDAENRETENSLSIGELITKAVDNKRYIFQDKRQKTMQNDWSLWIWGSQINSKHTTNILFQK